MNWTDAEDFCKEKGAHLASVTSSTINDYILEGKAIRNIPHLWVGGTDAEIEDVWKWTDGSAWEFTFWGPGEPNNFGTQCLVYHPSNTWDDRTCFWEDKFLCSQTRCQGRENQLWVGPCEKVSENIDPFENHFFVINYQHWTGTSALQ